MPGSLRSATALSIESVVGTSGMKPVALRGFGPAYWRYCAFTAVTMAGFATFALLGFHIATRHVVAPGWIPVMYALAMGLAIEYGPATEPWGVRRFYLRDPAGRLVNILSHAR